MDDRLAQVQRAFGAALRDSTREDDALRVLRGEPDVQRHRLGIYRANAIANATAALRAAYPVCVQLVGDTFFDALARAHWLAHPSTCGDLGRYGATFATFVQGFAPAAALPYLSDVARLEWAVHEASAAPDAPATPITREPALLWWPGTHVLAFEHPAADLWLAHQPDATIAFASIAPRPQGALVVRNGPAVEVSPIDRDEALALITHIEEGASS